MSEPISEDQPVYTNRFMRIVNEELEACKDEIKRLQAENAELVRQRDEAHREVVAALGYHQELLEQRDRLRAENTKLVRQRDEAQAQVQRWADRAFHAAIERNAMAAWVQELEADRRKIVEGFCLDPDQ